MTHPSKTTKTRKGDLAKETLKAAAIRVLNRSGFHQMRIKDVTAEAGVATGLFYHYFKNLETLVREIMDEHIAQFEATTDIEKDVGKGEWFSRMRSHYGLVVKIYAEEPGLMRCIQQFAADDAKFRQRWRQSYNWRLQQLAQAFPKVFPEANLSEAEIQLTVYSLSGVGQDFLNEYYVERNPSLYVYNYSQDDVAEWLAALFYRGLFASNPKASALQHATPLLNVNKTL